MYWSNTSAREEVEGVGVLANDVKVESPKDGT